MVLLFRKNTRPLDNKINNYFENRNFHVKVNKHFFHKQLIVINNNIDILLCYRIFFPNNFENNKKND